MGESSPAQLRLGAFRVEPEPIASGAVAFVHPGTHVPSGLPVAVKIIRAERSDVRGLLRSFEDEARTMARIDHPGVVRVFDYGAIRHPPDGWSLAPDSPYIIMERAVGSLTPDHITSWHDLRRTLSNLLRALAHVHAEGVVHRDLKPPNVLLFGRDDPLDVVRLADFGLVVPVRLHDHEGAAHGTPYYMAPEQHTVDAHQFGPWTDLYGLGCIAWHLVTGAPPFVSDSVSDEHLSAPLPSLKPRFEVPTELQAWLRWLLAKAPQHRPVCAADAEFALSRLELTATTAEPVSPTLEFADDLSTRPTTKRRDAPRPTPSEPPSWTHSGVPPMPASWKDESQSMATPQVAAAGLGLFGLRPLPFVGRTSVRDLLWRTLGEVVDGGGLRVVRIDGALGDGKSATIRWFAQHAYAVGVATPWTARYRPHGIEEGIRTMLDRVLRSGPHGSDDPRRGIPPELSETNATILLQYVEEAKQAGAGARTIREELAFDTLIRLLALGSEHRTVILALDDVQWGGDALRLVRALSRSPLAPHLRVLVVLSVWPRALAGRPDEARLLEEIERLGPVEQTHLGPVPETDLRRALQRSLGLEPRLADRLLEVVGRRPSVLARRLQALVRDGLLQVTGAGYVVPDDALDLAPGWKSIWDTALGDLNEGEVQQTEALAVLGEAAPRSEWALLCERLGLGRPRLDRLVRRGVLQVSRDEVAFGDPTVHDATVSRLRCTPRWVVWNREAALALRTLHPRPTSIGQERIGRHLLNANRLQEAFPALLDAMRARLSRSEYAAAHRLVTATERAMDREEAELDDPRRLQTSVVRLHVASLEGDWQTLEQHARALLANTTLNASTVGEANYALGLVKFFRDIDVLQALLHFAPAALQFAEIDDTKGLGRVRLVESGAYLRLARYAEAEDALNEAGSLFTRAQDPLGRLGVLFGRGRLHRAQGDIDKSLSVFETALSLVSAVEHPFDVARVHVERGLVLADARLVAESRRSLEIGLAAADRIDTAPQRWQARLGLARLRLLEGPADALDLFQQLSDEAITEKNRLAVAPLSLGLATAAAHSADWVRFDRALERYRNARTFAPVVQLDVLPLTQILASAPYGDDKTRHALAAAIANYEYLVRRGQVPPDSPPP